MVNHNECTVNIIGDTWKIVRVSSDEDLATMTSVKRFYIGMYYTDNNKTPCFIRQTICLQDEENNATIFIRGYDVESMSEMINLTGQQKRERIEFYTTIELNEIWKALEHTHTIKAIKTNVKPLLDLNSAVTLDEAYFENLMDHYRYYVETMRSIRAYIRIWISGIYLKRLMSGGEL